MRATLETLAVALLVGLARLVLGVVDLAGIFALSTPLAVAPWTVVTSVYAHGSIGHLLANALALLLVGPLVERRTTRFRFHAFVIGTGALAGIAQVTLGGLLGPSVAVLGLSGAVFALGGYLLAGNVVSATPGAAVVAVRTTAAPGVALIAHATGAFGGLVAGRAKLLDAR